jgi:RNA polymerase sigma-70 factor (ECF subfamily)
MRMMTPKELLLKAQQGDVEAFGSLYEFYFTPVYRYIFWRLQDKDMVEDLVQAVFAKVFKNLKKYQDQGKNPLAYFFTVSRNLIIDYQRKKKEASLDDLQEGGFQAADEKSSPASELDNKMRLENIIKALEVLGDEQREVIILKYLNDLSNQEIASLMNKKEEAIRQLQCRALKVLREKFKSEI